MITHAVAFRYAKALFILDCNNNNLEKRIVDFESMSKILKENPKLASFLNAPHIRLEDKKKLLYDSLSEKFDAIFMNFIVYLIRKKRFVNLRDIASEFRHMVNEHLGIWEADIVTAVPMDGDIEEKLEQRLEIDFHKKMKVNKKVDPNIIGGVILMINNQMIDWSVAGRLKKMKENL